MANLDNDPENENDTDGENNASADSSDSKSKKLLLIIVPAVIIIGISCFYCAPRKDQEQNRPINYTIVRHSNEQGAETESYTIFYDLPEIDIRLHNVPEKNQVVKIKLNLELSKMEDINTIEALSAKLSDAVITHTTELMPEEINDSEGLYWLRKELLYRMNLIAAPVKISNLNFKSFEIVKD